MGEGAPNNSVDFCRHRIHNTKWLDQKLLNTYDDDGDDESSSLMMIVRLSPTLSLSLSPVATPPNLQRTYVRTYQDQAVCHFGHCTHLLAHLRTYVHTCARARQPASVGSHYVHTSACTSAAAHLVDHHWAYPLRTYARTCHAPTTQNTYVRRTTSTYVRTLKRSRRQRANHPIIYRTQYPQVIFSVGQFLKVAHREPQWRTLHVPLVPRR